MDGDKQRFLVVELDKEALRIMKERKDNIIDRHPEIIELLGRTRYGTTRDKALFVFKGPELNLNYDHGRVYVADISELGEVKWKNIVEPLFISDRTIKTLFEMLGLKPVLETTEVDTLLNDIVVEIGSLPTQYEEVKYSTSIVDDLREWSQYKYKDKLDLINILYNNILEEFHIITDPLWKIYCYSEEDGIYRECEKELKNFIIDVATVAGVEKYVTRYVIKEVIERLKSATYVPWRKLENSKWMLVTANGYIINIWKWVNEGKLVVYNPSPEHFATSKLGAPLNIERLTKVAELVRGDDWFNIANELCPKIHKAFIDWVGEENSRVLYEVIGYTLYPKYSIHKAFMLVGEGSNGKSTYLSLIKHFLGPDNVAHVSLQDLAENRFAPSKLVGKLANIFPDIPSRPLRYTGIFKALTGEDRIFIDVKHKEGFFYENYAKLIFSANELPQVNDQTYAFWRRWILIEFPNTFPPNPGFIKKLLEPRELEGLLIIALLALQVLMRRREFSIKGDFKEQWMRRANSVYAFVKDMIETCSMEDPKCYEEKTELYNAYRDYCEENDLEPYSKTKFAIELQRLVKVKSGRKKLHGERVYVWVGIRLKRETQENREGLEEYIS